MKINHLETPQALRDVLMADSAIQAMVKENVFPIIADEETEGDYITLQRDGFSQERTKMGIARRSPFVYAYIVSADSQRSQNIAAKVLEVLEGEFVNPDMTVQLEDDSEEYESGKYIQVLKFLVII